MAQISLYLKEDEKNHADKQEQSRSGYIRSLIREDMNE